MASFLQLGAIMVLLIALAQSQPVQRQGYITVDASKSSNIFYWLVESSNDPAHDPVVLWMSGGYSLNIIKSY